MTKAVNPRTGEAFGPDFPDISQGDLLEVFAKAANAQISLNRLSPRGIATALRAIADTLDAHTDELATLADTETALGLPRLSGEVGRTSGQLRAFADGIVDGAHLQPVVSTLPAGPAKELQRIKQPVGVVSVFGASNFPFAFSVLGGDTAAALAAGCAVIAKAHPAHPGTSARVAELSRAALAHTNVPADALQLVHAVDPELSIQLVTHPTIAAVAFTGSTRVGRLLFNAGAQRPDPIPVYAELGSLNPVVFGPTAFATEEQLQDRATLFAQSMTNGWGQFCTKPGVLLVPNQHAENFSRALIASLEQIQPAHLLTAGISHNFSHHVAQVQQLENAHVWQGEAADAGFAVPATLIQTTGAAVQAEEALREEVFGPAAVVVAITDLDELHQTLRALGGNLTGTLHGDAADPWLHAALPLLQQQVGRIIYDGVPTGVAVAPAQQHGGPYPASTIASSTSVGWAGIERFLRPVAYQDLPTELVPHLEQSR